MRLYIIDERRYIPIYAKHPDSARAEVGSVGARTMADPPTMKP
jgi:hypothetical protein